jgi:exopolyphosphatase/guanosine-5'-triphosphate,3'-diphosphate pyrophosphatase
MFEPATPPPVAAPEASSPGASRCAAKAAVKAAKAAAKAGKRTAKAAAAAQKRTAKAAATAGKRAAKQAARAARKAAKDARRSAKDAVRAAKVATRAAASAELAEAATLLRHVAEPPLDPVVAGPPDRAVAAGATPAADTGAEPPDATELPHAAGPESTAEGEPEPPTLRPAMTPIEVVGGPGVTVGASVDVGANSVHLLVAAVGGHRLEPLVDESVFLGLGDRIDAEGYLGSAARGRLVAALVGYADTARRLGATAITFVGTEPMRRAADAATVTAEVERASGVALHVLGHDEEGILNLLGVTGGRPVTHELVVVDIGGGSSEIVVVGPGRAPVAAGVLVGSARLTQRLVREDPPAPAEIDALAAEARRIVAAEAPPGRPLELVAVGGTASNLRKVIPAAALERVLTPRRIAAALAMLATEPSAQAAERHAVNPTRARILPAGAVIVQALLEHYGVERLRVSEDGIREGAILVAAAAGHAWRDRLPGLALGWRHTTAPGGASG